MSILYFRVFTIFALLTLLISPRLFAESAPVVLKSLARIGVMSTAGVRATAYVTRLDPEKSAGATHRVRVVFVNERTGAAIEKGLVGIKYRRLYGAAIEPVWMESTPVQPEVFVADMILPQHGTYLFIVGSKLEDDKKRQFTFQYLYR
ncbi:MAG: hypothetical protein IBX47_06045 [Desulfuromonadales bacterium]|nr:hypothetical protein [Desulfuromonadales bacterium]